MLKFKTKEAQLKAKEKQCVHHWIIDCADGPVSVGKCKHCGMVKEFHNNLEEAIHTDKQSLNEGHDT
jgi:hypothetical protein